MPGDKLKHKHVINKLISTHLHEEFPPKQTLFNVFARVLLHVRVTECRPQSIGHLEVCMTIPNLLPNPDV